jgi:hypothetical protein
MKYITWNQFNAESLKQAEQRKQKLEKEGWTLVHETVGCLTYQSKYNKDAVQKEIKKSGVSAKEASLIHKLLKGHKS